MGDVALNVRSETISLRVVAVRALLYPSVRKVLSLRTRERECRLSSQYHRLAPFVFV